MRDSLHKLLLLLPLSLWAPGCLPPPAPRPIYSPAEPDKEVSAHKVPPPQVTVTDTRLVLNQAIFFEFDQDRILPISYPILDELARTLKDHPDIVLVRIEGHTDNVGTPSYNLNLSYRRSQSVMQHLLRRGVKDYRLHSAGFGPSQPIADNQTDEGRAQNRRVSFIIEQWQTPRGTLKAQR